MTDVRQSRLPHVPQDPAQAAARLGTVPIPPAIVECAQRLHDAGHAAVLVGGAVRDVLLGLDAADWDLASSAQPEEIQALFARTIPTGIEHGTVTVIMGRSKATAVHVEVTTFRGEGAYLDGRRPSEVTFHRDLVEDLARRDFTVNAFAWDPITHVFSDPFDGLVDLQKGWLRAVGDPVRRFGEDGLRTMRAVRLCATRGFRIEPHTEAAIPGALSVLAKVSRERIHVELEKLLGAAHPSAGLQPMVHTGIWPLVLPVLTPEAIAQAIADVDGLRADAVLRLARLLWPLAQAGQGERIEECLVGLRHGRAARARLGSLLGEGPQQLLTAATPGQIRRAAARIGRAYLDDAFALTRPNRDRAAVIEQALQGAVLAPAELCVRGRDLLQADLAQPGPALGLLLERLFAHVLEHPEANETQYLFDLVLKWRATPTDSGPEGS